MKVHAKNLKYVMKYETRGITKHVSLVLYHIPMEWCVVSPVMVKWPPLKKLLRKENVSGSLKTRFNSHLTVAGKFY